MPTAEERIVRLVTLLIGMRKLLSAGLILGFGLLGISAHGATAAKKKSGVKKSGKTTTVSASKKPGSTQSSSTKATSSKAAASKRGKKAPVRRATTWRNRQLTPTPDRYKQIQEALAAKGYLPAEQVNGKWDDASSEALKKFQADQKLDASGKINSLSLIALGLGPKRETASAAKPADAPAPTP